MARITTTITTRRLDLRAWQNETMKHMLTVKDSDVPRVWGATTAKMQVRDTAGVLLFTLTDAAAAGVGQLILGPTDGELVIRVEIATLGPATPDAYLYDLTLTVGGDTEHLLDGVFNLFEGVTTLP